MNCRECRDVLQLRLDGAEAGHSDAATAHLSECASCRGLFAAAERMLKGVAARQAVAVPSTLADRIVAQTTADRTRRLRRSRMRWTAIIGMAACVLVMIMAGQFLTRAPKHSPQTSPPIAERKQPPAILLAPRAEEARQAVAGLTGRLAEETREQARMFWSVAAIDRIPPMEGFDPRDPLDPAKESLKETGRQVSEGFEPVTRTARQAFAFLTREFSVLDRQPRQ